MIHVTIQQLSSYVDEQLAGDSADLVRQHLSACLECERKLSALARMDEALARALTDHPGDDLYQRLEREIASALAAEGNARAEEVVAVTPERAAPSTPARSRSVPTGIAAAGPARTHAAVASPGSSPKPQRSEPAPSAPQRPPKKESSAGLWITVFSLALIAGSAGVVVSHSGSVQGWLDGLVSNPNFTTRTPGASIPQPAVDTEPPATADAAAGTQDAAFATDMLATSQPEASRAPGTAPAPPRSLAPSEKETIDTNDDVDWDAEGLDGEETSPESMRADEAMSYPGAPASSSSASGRGSGGSKRDDPYANLRPETQATLREAERVHEQTLFHPTAEQFDIAARRWEEALEGLTGPEQVTVRGRLADARFRAWEAGPTDGRADAAMAAIRSYLLFAPPGISREEAKARLARISPR
jgi:hypothetical protein